MRARSWAAASPLVAGLRERVERVAIRCVADRMHRDRPPDCAPRRTISASSSRSISTPEPSSKRAVCEPSVPSMRPSIADAQQVAADARRQGELVDPVEMLGRERLPDPQREQPVVEQALPSPRRPEPAVLVVESRDPRAAASFSPSRMASMNSSSVGRRYRSRNVQADSSRRTPVGSPRSSTSTTPPSDCRSPSACARAAEVEPQRVVVRGP